MQASPIDYIHIGPQRCGTTTVYEALSALGMVPLQVKEIQYFDLHYDKPREWYFRHFEHPRENARPMGEVCPSYFSHVDAPARLHSLLPDIKLICTLRKPSERVVSMFRLLRMYDLCSENIEEAWEKSEKLRECCMYSRMLGRWMDCFSRDQIYISIFDDLEENANEYLKGILTWLDPTCDWKSLPTITRPHPELIPKYPVLNHLAANAGRLMRRAQLYSALSIVRSMLRPIIFSVGKPLANIDISESFQKHINEYYKDEIKLLSRITRRNLSGWFNTFDEKV